MGKMSELNKSNRKVKIRADGSIQVISEPGSETRTDQSFKDSQNINSIMKRYKSLGYDYNNMPNVASGAYGDFSKVKDFQSALNATLKVQENFNMLPSEVRKRFYNDPQKLMEFMKDPSNLDEAVRLGLVIKKPTPEKPLPEEKTPTEPKK